jgi:predicted O-methyltransferase YrrM
MAGGNPGGVPVSKQLFEPRVLSPREKAVYLSSTIDGWMDANELGWLYDRAGGLPEGGIWVEVGTWKGRSAVATALGLPKDGTLVCVDTFRGDGARKQEHAWEGGLTGWLLECFRLNAGMVKKIRADVSVLVRADRDDTVVLGDGAETFDAVFIDADHEYGAVRGDIEQWSGLLKPGGLLCGHDYHPAYPGVVKAVDELVGSKLKKGPGTIWWRKP